ncbi:REP element-mobilizing transposase RayT [Salirhabdus euzebyi]|uniref:REP element-mobilizing transposase RayT n=1 Tax=Salirhabdus euzebyi TaxID=394506 RepID=A0A841Q5H8_9BACI|nr:transposase [Salirhabdus euzebyi]MBB6453645.1 REP element-mobilizing transposase RayT [Salirhabdus euzebyi]
MARKHRIPWKTGEHYHITARGNRKESLFSDKKDYQKYLHYLKETKTSLPFNLHAYCLMPNHIHLLIEMQHHSISDIIKRIHTIYAMYYNVRYDLVGHLFQGRFKSEVVDSSDYLLEASRYIHLNPVKAGLTKRAEDWPWSSYQAYLKISENRLLLPLSPQDISTTKTLAHFPEPSTIHYQHFIKSKMDSK